MKRVLLTVIAALFLATGTAHAQTAEEDACAIAYMGHRPENKADYERCLARLKEPEGELQGAWHCVIPGTPTRHDETMDIELRKYAVHDNAYVIRGEFPVWGNDTGLSLKYTDDMDVIFFNGVPCQLIKDGSKP